MEEEFHDVDHLHKRHQAAISCTILTVGLVTSALEAKVLSPGSHRLGSGQIKVKPGRVWSASPCPFHPSVPTALPTASREGTVMGTEEMAGLQARKDHPCLLKHLCSAEVQLPSYASTLHSCCLLHLPWVHHQDGFAAPRP